MDNTEISSIAVAGPEWQTQPSGLRLRDDDFSWQGSVEDDMCFFLRRSKNELEKVTEHTFGGLFDEQVEILLSEFIAVTGGWTGNRLIFAAVGWQESTHVETVMAFDRIVKVAKGAAELGGRLIKDCLLFQDANRWNALIKFQH